MKMTKKLTAIAVCTILAATSMVGVVASAGFASSTLGFAGSALGSDGNMHYFSNAAQIETFNGGATGTAILYESKGIPAPANMMFAMVRIYGTDNAFIDDSDDFVANSSPTTRHAVPFTVFANYSSYKAVGVTAIDTNQSGSYDSLTACDTAVAGYVS